MMSGRKDAPGFLDRLRKHRRYVLVGVYIACYCVRSAQGGYYSCNSGGQDNADVWIAKGCGGNYRKPTGRPGERITPLGVIFLPIILIDRCLVHRDRRDD